MLKRRISKIREKRAEREREVRLLRGLEQFSESVQEALDDPSFETKQQVLRLVVDRIVVEDDKVVVHHVVPTGPVRLQTERQPSHNPNLIADCVIARNTVHYQRILDELREEGFPVNEEDLPHLSPTRYGHINPYGRYRFDLPPEEGGPSGQKPRPPSAS